LRAFAPSRSSREVDPLGLSLLYCQCCHRVFARAFFFATLNTCRITSSVPGWTWATRRRVPFVYCAWTRSRVFTDAPPARQNCMLDTPPPPPPAPRSSCIPPTLPLFLYRRSARVWVGSCAMGSLVEHNRGAIGDSLAPRESGTTLSPPAGVSAEVEVV